MLAKCFVQYAYNTHTKCFVRAHKMYTRFVHIYFYSYSLGLDFQQKRLEANIIDDCGYGIPTRGTSLCHCRKGVGPSI